jgi:ribose 5-phosphate isomerase RpiB
MLFAGHSRAKLIDSRMKITASFDIVGCIPGLIISLSGNMVAGVTAGLIGATTEAAVLEIVADTAPVGTRKQYLAEPVNTQ